MPTPPPPESGQYKPGQSGNLKGGPKGPHKSTLVKMLLAGVGVPDDIKQRLADSIGVTPENLDEALDFEQLRIALHGKKESDRTGAYKAAKDRAYGKPPQSVKLTDGDGNKLEPTIVILPDNGRDRDRKEDGKT